MSEFVIRTGIPVAMRDGVELATDVYRPAAGPGPVLLTRTPYDKDRVAGWSDDLDLFRALRAGYAVVVQDVRGRFASAGTFDAFAQEGDDGADTVDWIVARSWCDGTIGTFGKSYLGAIQWQLAARGLPSLKAMAPSMTPSDIYEGNTHQGGANVLHGLRWAVGLSASAAAVRARRGEPVPPDWERDFDLVAVIEHLPLSDHPAFAELAPFWPPWLAHPEAGPYWSAMSPTSSYEDVAVPVLNIGGWYDIMLGPALQNFHGARHLGRGAAAAASRLVIGPWSHIDLSGSFPDREFGPAASREAIDLNGLQLRWFDRWLRGRDAAGWDDDRPVLIFVMGADEWRTEADWPLPDTTYVEWFLHSDGAANTRHGDGTLSRRAPEEEPADVIRYDPLDPVPTVGGPVLITGANALGPRDQRTVEERDDVLVYTSEVLHTPVEVIGPVEFVAYVISTAPDTDITAKLVDVFPDGRAINLTDGITRLRYRHSRAEPELMNPGEAYEVHVDLWGTANVFGVGHRIRLEVSSSNFPRFGRNSNTGGVIADEPRSSYVAATNQILHDAGHGSRLILPTIERRIP